MEITITKETLKENLIKYFTEDCIRSLEVSDFDQEERDATLVLSRKRIDADSQTIVDLVYKSYGHTESV
jgi:hypothetical protein